MKQNVNPRIYVVEDNLIYQQLIEKELESISDFIRFFTNGEACLKMVTADLPDVLVLDYNLEGEMTGLDTLKASRSVNPDVYAVVFSTQPCLDTHNNLVAFGQFDFIEKTDDSFYRLREIISSRY
ncbi:MAG: response regulator [Chitinophagaceae bacterium]